MKDTLSNVGAAHVGTPTESSKASFRPAWLGLLRGGEESQVERRQLACTTAFVVGLHLLPRLLLGQRSYVTVHDNLETDLLYRVLIARDHRMFSGHAIVSELMGGLPRWDYPSALKLGSMLFWLLPAFWAYVVLEACVRAVAVLGMGVLLRDYVPAARAHRLAVAATFGILPFYTVYDLSVAGEPLVAWALLNLWHERRIRGSLAICAAYPFASVLWTGPPFCLALAGFVLALAALHRRRLPLYALAGLVVAGLGYLVSDQQYLSGLLRAEFVSHRSAWHDAHRSYDFATLIHASEGLFLHGKYHAASVHTPILVVTSLLVPVLALRGFRREAGVLCTIIVVAACCALSTQAAFLRVLDPLYVHAPGLRQINVRFWWAQPLIWYVALCVIALWWSKTGLPGRLLNVVLAFQFAWAFVAPYPGRATVDGELRKNYLALADRLLGRTPEAMSYAEFISAPAFAQIRKHVGADSGRVVSVGLHPASAAYNGFACADGLHDNYPLAYKLRFRRLIAKELRYNQRNREYFDGWGGRASVLIRDFALSDYDQRQARPPRTLHELDLSEAALHDLGIKWIVSALRLAGHALPEFLSYHGVYGDPNAGYVLFLYRVRD